MGKDFNWVAGITAGTSGLALVIVQTVIVWMTRGVDERSLCCRLGSGCIGPGVVGSHAPQEHPGVEPTYDSGPIMAGPDVSWASRHLHFSLAGHRNLFH
jgi:hypothetical protein